jgi:hypothetical protein
MAVMPWGKYRNWNLRDLPDDYLHWLWSSAQNVSPILRAAIEREYEYRIEAKSLRPPVEMGADDIGLYRELIQAGYRALSMKYHPDKKSGSADVMLHLNLLVERIRKGCEKIK